MDDTSLEFEGPAFTDAELRALPNLDQVQMICLRDTAITDKGCSELLRARSLVEISVISDTLSDDLLWVLAQLPALRSIQVHHGPRIGDDGVRFLAGCAGLRELYLKKTAITDRGLKEIGGLPQVWSVILDDTRISDDGCAALAGMQKLSLLSLKRTRVIGHSLTTLRNNEHFNLYLEGTPVTDEGVTAFVRQLTNLKLASLNQTQVGDTAASELARLSRLDEVRLSNTKLTDDGVAAFIEHPCLEVIYIEGCSVSKRAVKALKEASPRSLIVYGP